MTTLSDIRDRLRTDLRDTDSDAYRWPDDALDRHIAHALQDFSLAIPLEMSAFLASTPGSRELSLASLVDLIEVERVEYPAGHFPPCEVEFSRWGTTLYLHTDQPPSGDDVQVLYLARHKLDDSSGTIPHELEDVVVMGAAGYALTEMAVSAIDRLNTGGPEVTELWAASGRARLTAFRQLLQHYGRSNRVTGRRLYRPA